jgi:L-fuconolactonase
MIIDAHQHFWLLSRADYDWLRPDQAVLYRDYLPTDLAPLLLDNGVRATVLVQATPSEVETRYLFRLAQENSFIAGVIGWVDFESPVAPLRISALMADGSGKLKGVRQMIQDIADPHWISQPAFDAAFEAIIANDLVFDALVRPPQIDALRRRLMRHPTMRAILNHAGKPDIGNDGFGVWADDLERLARDTGVHCKLSGLLTEAGTMSSTESLAPYVEHIFRCFGPERVLWGSDWPVLNLAGDYAHWLALSRDLVGHFAPSHVEAVFADTAAHFYRLGIP